MFTQMLMDQADVIASGDAEAQYLFARDVLKADMPALFAAVMTGGDTKWIFEFVFKLPAASIVAAVQFAAIETGSGMDQYHAVMYEGADIPALQSAVIESGDAFAQYLFARHIEGADIEALTDAMNASTDRIAQLEFCDDSKRHDPGFKHDSQPSCKPTGDGHG